MRPRPNARPAAALPRSPASALALSVGLVLGSAASGCAGSASVRQEPRSESLHPQGIAVDPEPELPETAASAEAARGLVVLSEPEDPEAARGTVVDFFDAVASESEDALERVLAPGARTRAGAKGRPELALAEWRKRFQKLDYRALEAGLFYRKAALEVYTGASVSRIPERLLAVPPKKNEILVRVPVTPGRATGLLGPELLFSIACSGAACKITEIVEDFRIP